MPSHKNARKAAPKKAPSAATKKNEPAGTTLGAGGESKPHVNLSTAAAASAAASASAEGVHDSHLLVADHHSAPPINHDAQVMGTTNMASVEVPHYGDTENSDFNPQKCYLDRSKHEEFNLKPLHSSGSFKRQRSEGRSEEALRQPNADLKMSDFTSLKPHEFHPRDDQPMMGRGGQGWISEIDGTTTTTATTPDKGTRRGLSSEATNGGSNTINGGAELLDIHENLLKEKL